MGDNPFAGQGLDSQVKNAYTGALGSTADLASGNALARTDLTPYYNPFLKGVIGTTMGELNRQQDLGRLNIANEAQAQNAFGGDRFAIESAANARDWNQQKANTLSQLNKAGYDSAVEGAKFDIGTQGAAAGALGGLANQGFQWGNDLAAQSNAAGAQQQQAMQGLVDAIKAQYQGFTGQGASGLEPLLGALGALGSNLSSSSSKAKGSSMGFNIGGGK
jgi:hypothetical protein